MVSYLVLRGRCRTCRAPIAVRYPIVEALTALMFGAAWWHFGPGVLLASRLVFGCALIVLFAIDLEHHLLPNVITLPGIVVGFAFSFFTEPGWTSSLIGIARRRRHRSLRSPRCTTACGTRKGWAWAT